MENDFLKLIKSRRSCRHFKPEQVADEELQAVFEPVFTGIIRSSFPCINKVGTMLEETAFKGLVSFRS